VGKKGGRPPKYNSKEEIQVLADKYFEECEEKSKPLTITGLALALGFNSRQALLNYQNKQEFNDTIVRAKAKVEQYAEERLFDKEGANGAKFSLANNFDGWRERQQVDANLSAGVVFMAGEDDLSE
jgi:hypothetical protein